MTYSTPVPAGGRPGPPMLDGPVSIDLEQSVPTITRDGLIYPEHVHPPTRTPAADYPYIPTRAPLPAKRTEQRHEEPPMNAKLGNALIWVRANKWVVLPAIAAILVVALFVGQ